MALRTIREGLAPGNLVGWLHQVLRITIVDHYRARRTDDALVEDIASTDEPV